MTSSPGRVWALPKKSSPSPPKMDEPGPSPGLDPSLCVTTRDVSKRIIYCSTIFSIFNPPCLVLHSFSALQNQPLLILNMYDFGDVKGTQPFDLTLHTVDSKITRLLYDPRFRQVECMQFTFLCPHPLISFFVKFSTW